MAKHNEQLSIQNLSVTITEVLAHKRREDGQHTAMKSAREPIMICGKSVAQALSDAGPKPSLAHLAACARFGVAILGGTLQTGNKEVEDCMGSPGAAF